jgi:hypothetical protein
MARSEDCKIRTIEPAKVATAAFFSSYDVRWVISLRVERRGECQYAGGAKLDTEAAALTPFDGDEDRTFGHL